MQSQKQKIPFYTLAKNLGTLVITGFLLLITFYLTYKSFIGTADMSAAGDMLEQLIFLKDNVFLNIVAAIIIILLIAVLLRLTKNVHPAYFTVILLFLTLTLGTLWCYFSSTVPTNDSRIVVSAGFDAALGIYEDFSGNYLSKYFPFQTGYVFFTEILVRLFSIQYGQFVPLQIVNVFFLCLAYFALLKITDIAFNSDTVHKLTCILLATALSPIFFSTFLYGNLVGLGFALLSIWQMLLFLKNNKILHAVISAITIGLAVLVKLNYSIVLVAEIIITVLNFVPKKKELLKRALYIVLSLFMVFSLQKAVLFMYSQRSGSEFSDGIPMTSWAAMGLSEAYIEAGWYDQEYTVRNYLKSDCDSAAASEKSLEVIKTRLIRFADIPEYAADFFDRKISSQWNETTFQSLWTNEVRLKANEIHPVSRFLLKDCDYTIKAFMDHHAQMIFLGAFAATIMLLRKRNNASTTLMLVILGGFLYHSVFEAKSQYILPYFIIMIPLAAYGLTYISSKACKALKYIWMHRCKTEK